MAVGAMRVLGLHAVLVYTAYSRIPTVTAVIRYYVNGHDSYRKPEI